MAISECATHATYSRHTPYSKLVLVFLSLFLMDAQKIDKNIFTVSLNDAKHKRAKILAKLSSHILHRTHTHTGARRRSCALVPRCVINTFQILQKSRGATNVGFLLRCVAFVRHFLIVSWVSVGEWGFCVCLCMCQFVLVGVGKGSAVGNSLNCCHA